MKHIIRLIPILMTLLLISACKEGIESYDGLYIVGTQGKEVTATLH